MPADGANSALRFGISLVPAIERLDRIRELARAADENALDLVGIQDHPYQRHFLDAWSLIATLLAETTRGRARDPCIRLVSGSEHSSLG